MDAAAEPTSEGSFKLELVQVLFRHGERMPMKPAALFAGFTQTFPWSSLRTPRADSKPTSSEASQEQDISQIDLDDDYVPNELTTLGYQTTRAIGQRLRERYVDNFHFLPVKLQDSAHIHMRSSVLPRSYNSLKSVFEGLYPVESRDPGHTIPVIHTREPQHENLYPNRTHGPRLRELTEVFQQRAAQTWNGSPQVAYLKQLLAGSSYCEIAVNSVPSMEQLRDYIICKLAAKTPQDEIPSCFQDPDALRTMEDICIDFRLSGFIASAEIRALGVGTLLDELFGRMQSIRQMSSHDSAATVVPRFVLLSSHDTTLAAILICLEAAQEVRWPGFSTTLVFELLSLPGASVQYYVRILWNDQIVRIPRLDQDPLGVQGHAGIYGLNSLARLLEERTSTSSTV